MSKKRKAQFAHLNSELYRLQNEVRETNELLGNIQNYLGELWAETGVGKEDIKKLTELFLHLI